MAWTDYSSAPAAGTDLCAAAQVQGVLSLKIETERGVFPVLVLRAGGEFRAYVNACPHQYLPLDYRGGGLLSADGARLMCSAHGAQFDIKTGEAKAGPVQGPDCALDAVPLREEGGRLRIGGA